MSEKIKNFWESPMTDYPKAFLEGIGFGLLVGLIITLLILYVTDFPTDWSEALSNPSTTVGDVISQCDHTPMPAWHMVQVTLNGRAEELTRNNLDATLIYDLRVGRPVCTNNCEYQVFPPDVIPVASYFGYEINHPSIHQTYSPGTGQQWLTIFPDHYQLTPVEACGVYELLGSND